MTGGTWRGGLLVLAWHNVEPTWFFEGRPGAGAHRLARQLDALARVARIVALEPALDELRAGRPLAERSVALTFDDGYRDARVAADVLDRRGLTATFFLVPAVLDGRLAPWWELLGWAVRTTELRRAHLPGGAVDLAGFHARRRALATLAARLRRADAGARAGLLDEVLRTLRPDRRLDPASLFLDWDGARDLVRRGHAIGSHTSRHLALSRQDDATVAAELAGSRAALSETLGVEVRTLAYPYGNAEDLDARAPAAATAAGYAYGLTTSPGVNRVGSDWLRLHRQVVGTGRGVTGLLVARHSFGGARRVVARALSGRSSSPAPGGRATATGRATRSPHPVPPPGTDRADPASAPRR